MTSPKNLETRLRELPLEPPAGLAGRALAAAAVPAEWRPARWGRRLAAVATAALMLYTGAAVVAAEAAAPADNLGEGCWFVRDSSGLHFHIGGFYRGLPALCTAERR